MFKWLRRKRVEEVLRNVNKKDLFKRYLLLATGCFIVAFAFNVFFLQNSIVCFGVSGVSIILNQFGVPPSLFILMTNIVLLIICYFTLGVTKTKNSIIGSLLFPMFVSITKNFVPYIDISGLELIVIAMFGAVMAGIGYGLIYKTGFTTGGTDIINQILVKYCKISTGKAMLMVDGLVVTSAILVFDWEIVLYGYIVLYVMSTLTDKVLLGISQSKAFYIITNKEKDAKEYLLTIDNAGVTLINSKGGYMEDKHNLLLAVVPTRSYYLVKEGLKTIDPQVFFLVCDAYEVSSKEN